MVFDVIHCKMYLRQIFIFSFLLVFIASFPLKPTEQIRSKRTINYFFDGLFNVLSDKRSYNSKSRASNDHKLSPLATLAKLSSISTQLKKFNALDDDDDERSSEVENYKNPVRKQALQLPIPKISSDIPLANEMTNIQISPFLKKSYNGTTTGHSKKVLSQTETKITTEVNGRTSSSVELTTELPDTKTVTGNSVTTFVTTTFDPIITTQDSYVNTISSNFTEDTTENDIFKSKKAFKKSDRHTFFNDPLIVERHPDDHQHSPVYSNNCEGAKCEEIHPYESPNFRDFFASLISDESIAKTKNVARSQMSLTDDSDSKMYSVHKTPIIYLYQPHVQFHTALH